MIASYRDDALDRSHPLRVVLGELATATPSARLSSQPLSPEAVARLAERRGVDADELYRSTGGNPFFVSEVLAAGPGEIPQTVRDAVLARASPARPAGADGPRRGGDLPAARGAAGCSRRWPATPSTRSTSASAPGC